MSKKETSKEAFYRALELKSIPSLIAQINNGVLETMRNNELKDVFLQIMLLRNRELIDLLAKKSHYFPMEMLEVPIANQNDKDFVSYVLSRHGKKFRYKIPENANRLFAIGCAAECAPFLLFLMKKGLAEGEYPRLISGSEALLEVLDMLRVSALHKDTIVTFFVEAAISGHAEDRIRILQHLKFNILTKNSEGMNACEVLKRGIENYKYAKGKQGTLEKQKDLQSLKTLERFYVQALEK